MVQWQCKEKQSVWVRVRYKNTTGSRKNGKKAREYFFSLSLCVWAVPNVFCSVRGTKGSSCISPPSLDRAHVVIFFCYVVPVVHSFSFTGQCLLRVRIVLLLSKLLYFFLSFSHFLLFSFSLSLSLLLFFCFFLFFTICATTTMYEYVCVVVIAASTRFCYWVPTHWRRWEKKVWYTYERKKERERERDQSMR